MKTIFNWALFILGGITIAILAWFFITASRTEFNFANNGKIICVTQKAAGFGQTDELNCFNITPVGQTQDVQKFDCKTVNGEIVVTK